MSVHHDGDNTLKRVTEHYFPRGIPPTEKKCKPTRRCVGCIKHKKKEKLYTNIKIVNLFHASAPFLRPSIRGQITEVV